MFCPRIIAFNESFVPLGSSKEKLFAAVWHEAVSGRRQEDIISTFRAFLKVNVIAMKLLFGPTIAPVKIKIGHFLHFWYKLLIATNFFIKYFERYTRLCLQTIFIIRLKIRFKKQKKCMIFSILLIEYSYQIQVKLM